MEADEEADRSRFLLIQWGAEAMAMGRSGILAVLVMVLLPGTILVGCAGLRGAKDPAADGAKHSKVDASSSEAGAESDDSESPAKKRKEIERAVAVARAKLDQARADLEDRIQEGGEKVRVAEAELDLAERHLRDFKDHDSGLRLEEARHDLQKQENAVKESQEELAQLEEMYKEDDLADATKEIVLQRMRRRLELDQQGLKLQQAQLARMEGQTLPLEAAELEAAAQEKRGALETARRDASSGEREARIAVMEAEFELAGREEALAALPKDADAKGAAE